VIAIQGFHFQGQGSKKKPARLVSVGPRGGTEWVFDGGAVGARWFYDVDPLPNGNLLAVTTNSDGTVVFELDPETRERVWVQRLPIEDTHDVAWLGDGRIAVANMRAWNGSCDCSDDRVFVYDVRNDTVTWEWYFRDHYPNATDGGFPEDWTHVNDVDVLPGNRLLLSPRNFDQVIVVDRETGEITERLGSDDDHDVLHEQHNPDYVRDEEGNPTMLVADSENDRVIEYTRVDGEWEETWVVGSSATLSWPRDADRLPNGNTLIVDSLNHRVIEVTPQGRIVWEYYATWGPFDVERPAHGQGSNGPAMRDVGVSGHHEIHGSAGNIEADRQSFATWLVTTAEGTPIEEPATSVARRWSHVAPWLRPVWLSSWDFVALVAGLVVLTGWGFAELVAGRRRLLADADAAASRIG
jgi:WD40 repeat protein